MDNIEQEMIRANINYQLSTYPGTYPIIALDEGYEKNKSVIYLDPNSPDLKEKIEELAKSFKRNDINRILILQEKVESYQPITDIGIMFEDEDIFLHGIIAFVVDKQAANELHENFRLRIISYQITDLKEKTYKKK